MLHASDPAWLRLDPVALHIARGILAGQDAARIAEELVGGFEVTPGQAARDVERVRGRLDAEGFGPATAGAPLRRDPELRSLFLHLTARCNLRCAHCYAAAPGPPARADLPRDRVLDLLDQLVRQGGQGVTLSGGEPLCHPAAKEILEHAARRLTVRLLTNGALVDGDLAGWLAELGVFISVSLDGSRPEIHDATRGDGSFAAALAGIRRLVAAGAGQRVNLNTTVTARNLRDLPRVVALAQDLGLPLVRLLPLRRAGHARRSWPLLGAGLTLQGYEGLFDLAARWQREGTFRLQVSCGLSGVVLGRPAGDPLWCPVGRTLVVDHRGRAYPCVLLMTPAHQLGDVTRQPLRQILDAEPMAAICDTLARRRLEIPACAPCAWRNLCQGGCMGQALEHRGTLWQADHFCAYRQRAYAEAFDRLLAGPPPGSGPGR